MIDNICNSSGEYGNLADWINALGAIVLGCGIWYVSVRSNAINSSLQALERQRDLDTRSLRAREQRILLVGLASQLGTALVSLRNFKRIINSANARQDFIEIAESREALEKIVKSGAFAINESTRNRLHFLDDRQAALIIRTEGHFTLVLSGFDHARDNNQEGRAIIFQTFQMMSDKIVEEALEAYNYCQAAGREMGLKTSDIKI